LPDLSPPQGLNVGVLAGVIHPLSDPDFKYKQMSAGKPIPDIFTNTFLHIN